MKLHKDMIPEVIERWITSYVLPKIPESHKRMILMFFWYQMRDTALDKFKMYLPVLGENSSGNYDIDTAYRSAVQALETCKTENQKGILIPHLEWVFDKEDIDNIYKIARDLAQ